MSIIARIPTRFLKTALAATVVVAAVAGCSSDKWGFPYKAPVQQGNWITQEQVALLQPGMTREQVRFALGSPTLTSALHANRWDYPYYFKPGYGDAQERKFTVWFDNDRLLRWEGDKQPELQPFQLNAEGTAQAKTDEQIDADMARQDADGAIRSAVPADAAQLPALGTPPGGALPADSASGTTVPADVTGTAPDSGQATGGSGIRAPSMSGADAMPPEADTAPVHQRELRLNAPSTRSPSSANPATDSAEPLR